MSNQGISAKEKGKKLKVITLTLSPKMAAVEIALLEKLHKQSKKTKGKKTND